jgi:hypothetical protein
VGGVLPGGSGPALWCEGGFATGGRPATVAPEYDVGAGATPWSIGFVAPIGCVRIGREPVSPPSCDERPLGAEACPSPADDIDDALPTPCAPPSSDLRSSLRRVIASRFSAICRLCRLAMSAASRCCSATSCSISRSSSTSSSSKCTDVMYVRSSEITDDAVDDGAPCDSAGHPWLPW